MLEENYKRARTKRFVHRPIEGTIQQTLHSLWEQLAAIHGQNHHVSPPGFHGSKLTGRFA